MYYRLLIFCFTLANVVNYFNMTNFFQSFFIWAIIGLKNISFAATMTKQKTLYLQSKTKYDTRFSCDFSKRINHIRNISKFILMKNLFNKKSIPH